MSPGGAAPLLAVLAAAALQHAAADLLVARPAPEASDSSTCGSSGNAVDCDHPDTGSCGNACCALEVHLDQEPDAVYHLVKDFLQGGGDGGAYSYVPGAMPFHEHPPDDLRGGGNEWKFIVQGHHTTSGRHYVDTLDFNIRSIEPNYAKLRLFSISDLHGALGDAGQNYKTLAYLLRAIGIDVGSARVLHGCGASPASAGESLLQRGRRGAETGRANLVRRKNADPALASGATKGPPGSSCGLRPSSHVPDCDHPDMGSCGNACCTVEVTLDMTPEAAHEMLVHALQGGGDHGSLAYVNGTMPHGEHPADDLRQFHMEYKFIVQGTHTTAARHYVDTLDFNIKVTDSGSTVLRAFSISNLHGALGDAGQNYKNLAYVLSTMGIDGGDIAKIYGCYA